MKQDNLDPTAGARARAIREHPEVSQRNLDPTDPHCDQLLTEPAPTPSRDDLDQGDNSRHGEPRRGGLRHRNLGHVWSRV